jgi:hypothetical protein
MEIAQNIDPIILYNQNFPSFIPLEPAMKGMNARVKL